MATKSEKLEIFDYWNSKNIVVHKRMTHDIELAISSVLKNYTVEEVKGFIDFYATILEPGVPAEKKKYFWSYRWNLWEFLKRGVKKFDGQELSNYQHRQRIESPEAIVFKRK